MSGGRTSPHYKYRPAWWLRSAHAQTMWGRFARRVPRIPTTIEFLSSNDGDRIELHHVLPQHLDAPRLLLLHGLEGSPRSHYVGGLLQQAASHGWGATLLVFRGCGSAPNEARRFYHSGETEDLRQCFRTLSERWKGPWLLAGVSLGGNVLLKWLGEEGSSLGGRVLAAAAVSVPYDLEAGARHIAKGFARVYDRSFLKSLRRKAAAKLQRYPDLFDGEALRRARSVFEFDDVVAGPVHGFADARDYYQRSSSLHFLERIRVPTLLLSARDDPFLPSDLLPRVGQVAARNECLTTEFHDRGGHVGFISGAMPWRPLYYAEWRIVDFLEGVMERGAESGYDLKADSKPTKRFGA